MLKLPRLRKNVELAPFTTYKIGGLADYFVDVRSSNELTGAVINARENQVPYFILGTGANILVGDGGFRGLVIHNLASSYRFSGNCLTAESGATIADLIESSTKAGLSGLEHYAGIPSSVGGAIWQNLHFLSPDRRSTLFIANIVKSASVLDENNLTQEVEDDYFKFGYDDSILHHKDIVVLEATFQLRPVSSRLIKKRIAANLAWRDAKQPQLSEFPSCGSVFKKIEGVGAGRLIEGAGLKGSSVGGAVVSEKHANYIINIGHATAADVRTLIKKIQDKVLEDSGHRLEPEINFVGEF